MIAADTSAWIDFFKGNSTSVCRRLEQSLTEGNLVMVLPVLFEILSSPGTNARTSDLVTQIPQLEFHPDIWQRSANNRKILLRKGLKARSMDCLIAQSCIDHKVTLIAADRDFRHFEKFGLNLLF